MTSKIDDRAARELVRAATDRERPVKRLTAIPAPKLAALAEWLERANSRRDAVEARTVTLVQCNEALARIRAKLT